MDCTNPGLILCEGGLVVHDDRSGVLPVYNILIVGIEIHHVVVLIMETWMVFPAQAIVNGEGLRKLKVVLHESRIGFRVGVRVWVDHRGDGAQIGIAQQKRGKRNGVTGPQQRTHRRAIER